MTDDIKAFETELNRGFLQILVLAALERRMYGYRMVKHLEEAGYAVEENTLYPLLRRLERNGWIASEWDVSEERPRKFYSVTDRGRAVRQRALSVWARQSEILKRIEEGGNDVRNS